MKLIRLYIKRLFCSHWWEHNKFLEWYGHTDFYCIRCGKHSSNSDLFDVIKHIQKHKAKPIVNPSMPCSPEQSKQEEGK